eukprot:COSAG05_NODE_1134_length_5765_cov_73.147017_2_plen_60_part_00
MGRVIRGQVGAVDGLMGRVIQGQVGAVDGLMGRVIQGEVGAVGASRRKPFSIQSRENWY